MSKACGIDHIDVLFKPRAYCEQLQLRFAKTLYIIVKKIVARYESLPDWPIAGSTGYDFVNQVLELFVDPEGEAAMTRIYGRFGNPDESFDDILYACWKRIMQVNLGSEMNVLARELHDLSMSEWRTPGLHIERHAGRTRRGHRGFSGVPHVCVAARRQRRRSPLHRLGSGAGEETLACC
jgi:maltooligosyltrehalose synthase